MHEPITIAPRKRVMPLDVSASVKGRFKVFLSPLPSSASIKSPMTASLSPDIGFSKLKSPRLVPIRSPRESSPTDPNDRFSFKVTKTEGNEDSMEYFDKMMRTTAKDEVLGDDEKLNENDIVGPRAVQNYYSHFKKLDKVKDQNTHNNIKDSAFTSILSKSESLCILPSKIGFIKESGNNSVVSINHFRIGDKYAEVLGEGLRNNPKVRTFNLANNRLTPKGAEFILSRVTRNAERIDLSYNNIGKIGCEYISRLIESKNSNLQYLNLEGNKLGDIAIIKICDALQQNREIRKLNLAKNFLTNLCTERLSAALQNNDNMKELYLYWNQIQGQGGNNLLKGLSANTSLKILDLAWNSLGLNPCGFGKNFAEYIAANTELIVLDLSNNNFGKEDSKIIAAGLEKNHTLYEFQFQGNYGYVDSLGFLSINDDYQSDFSSQHVSAHNTGVYPNPDLIKRFENITDEIHDGCWITEGWRAVKFTWTPGDSGPAENDPIYLHLLHDGNQAIWLPSIHNYTVELMCPPGTIRYFFTANGVQTAAMDQPQESTGVSHVEGHIYGKPFSRKLSHYNVYENDIDMKILDSNCEVTCQLKPRIRHETYIAPETEKEKIHWTVSMSVFREYKNDTDDIVKRCFNADYETSRIQKIVKKPEELEKVRELLFEAYKPLKGAYKYLSAIGAVGDVYCIGTNAFTDFLSKCNMIDDTLRLKDADLKFIATYTKTDPALMKNYRNPDRVLVRYQFLEVWVRLAEQKFISNHIVNNIVEAVEKLLSDHLLPYIKAHEPFFFPQKWREERYWTEDVDAVYKSYLPVVQALYKKYSGLKTKPGQKSFTCLEEMQKLATEAGILNDNLVERDVVAAFSLSMMTQVDELQSDRIFQMSFVEFLEAVARIAEVYSACKPGEKESDTNLEERKARPLHFKLEGLINILFERVCDNSVKDLFGMPEQSIFEEEITEAVGPINKKGGKKRYVVRVDPVHYYFAQTNSTNQIL